MECIILISVVIFIAIIIIFILSKKSKISRLHTLSGNLKNELSNISEIAQNNSRNHHIIPAIKTVENMNIQFSTEDDYKIFLKICERIIFDIINNSGLYPNAIGLCNICMKMQKILDE